MKRYLLGFLYFYMVNIWALISTSIDSSKIYIDEVVKLKVIISNPVSVNVGADLTPLNENFTILGSAQSMNYQIINGKAKSLGEWIITLQPKRVGKLVIPIIHVAGEKTTPIVIEVLNLPANNNSNNKNISPYQPTTNTSLNKNNPSKTKDVFIKTIVDEKDPLINQKVIYKVKIYNKSHVLEANFFPPSVDDALLISLGRGKQFEEVKNGSLYTVEEQEYAIFPQKSGKVVINPPQLTAVIFKGLPQRINVSGKPLVLNVAKLSPKFFDKHLFIAK